MNIFLVAPMGAGKDIVATMLSNHRPIAIADELRLLARNLRVNGVSAAFIHASRLLGESPNGLMRNLRAFAEIPRTTKDRALLQELGTYMRTLDAKVWLNAVKVDSKANYVITDVRYRAEFDFFVNKGFKGIYIECDRDTRIQRLIARDGNYNANSELHVAELEIEGLKGLCDARIINQGSLDELRHNVDITMAYLEFSMTN